MNATPTPKPIVQPQTSRHATLQRLVFDELLVLDPICDRLNFVVDALSGKQDWIDDRAACHLHSTLRRIHDDLNASYQRLAQGRAS